MSLLRILQIPEFGHSPAKTKLYGAAEELRRSRLLSRDRDGNNSQNVIFATMRRKHASRLTARASCETLDAGHESQ